MGRVKAGRRPTPRVHTDPDARLWPCAHCGTERILAPLSLMLGLARRQGQDEMFKALTVLLEFVGRDETISICPGCHCITPDLFGHGNHHAA